MNEFTDMAPEQSFFAVFCIEQLAVDLGLAGDVVYKMLVDDSDILDTYIVPCYDALHTQGRDWIVDDLKDVMRRRGMIR
ncbi:MAG: DUF3791 domain-containing protein [Clostridiales Family XIII bacterium]|jgi:hypothetical protein|nr:DUF3791 domain-containing protein [Clostridiales Family XIII bacterium]